MAIKGAQSRLRLKYEFPRLQLMHAYEVRPRKDKRGVDFILSRQRACQLAVFLGKLPHENNRSIHCWSTDCHCAWAQIDKASGTVWLPGSGGTLNGRHNYQIGLRPDGVVVWRWSP